MYAAEHAALHPDQPAIIMATSGEVVTYAAYEAGANQVAHLLRETGVRRRDHVAIFMDNEPLMLVAEGGAERSGRVLHLHQLVPLDGRGGLHHQRLRTRRS